MFFRKKKKICEYCEKTREQHAKLIVNISRWQKEIIGEFNNKLAEINKKDSEYYRENRKLIEKVIADNSIVLENTAKYTETLHKLLGELCESKTKKG